MKGSTKFREAGLHTITVVNVKQAQASILSAPVTSRSNIWFVTSVTISPCVYVYHTAEQSCSYGQNPSGQLLWWMQYFSLLFMGDIFWSSPEGLPLIHLSACSARAHTHTHTQTLSCYIMYINLCSMCRFTIHGWLSIGTWDMKIWISNPSISENQYSLNIDDEKFWAYVQ